MPLQSAQAKKLARRLRGRGSKTDTKVLRSGHSRSGLARSASFSSQRRGCWICSHVYSSLRSSEDSMARANRKLSFVALVAFMAVAVAMPTIAADGQRAHMLNVDATDV